MALQFGSSPPLLTPPELELSAVRTELHSIEELLHTILQRHSDLLSKLNHLQQQDHPPLYSTTSPPAPESVIEPSQTCWPSLPWNEVLSAKSKKKARRTARRQNPRHQPPVDVDPFGSSILSVSTNFNNLPKKLTRASKVASQVALAASSRPTGGASISNNTNVTPTQSVRSKRPHRSSISPPASQKRARFSSPKSRSKSTLKSVGNQGLPPDMQVTLDAPVVSSDVISPHPDDATPNPPDQPRESTTPPAGLEVLGPPLADRLSVYEDPQSDRAPEVIVIGDSIVRSVTIPNAITYCLSGAKVAELIEISPILVDRHPSAHTYVFHVGSNDVLNRESIRLRLNLESLVATIEGLGKNCVFSGPIPAPQKSSEHFSRIWALHEWLKTLCTSTGHGFISNFDCFWTRNGLFKADGLHPNGRGASEMARNYRHFFESVRSKTIPSVLNNIH